MTPSDMMQPFEQCFTAAFTHENASMGCHYYPHPLLEGYPSQGDFQPTFYNPFEIKHRRRTSKAQLKILEKSFAENPKPSATVRRVLAQKLDMTPRGVQIWFQNRRAKAKKLQRRQVNAAVAAIDRRTDDEEEEEEEEEEFYEGKLVVDKHRQHHHFMVPSESAWYDLVAPLVPESYGLQHPPVSVASAASAVPQPVWSTQEEENSLWWAMSTATHPLAFPERWLFPAEDDRSKPSYADLQIINGPSMPSQRCHAIPVTQEEQQQPDEEQHGLSGDSTRWPEHCPVDFYPSIPVTQPQQELTPLLSAGSGSPSSMDGYGYYSYDTDALLSLL
ncbi:hypothetical protein EC973_002850 [Apophysomyces ossiformis]|uniref:Homeobox domain-containing protein n=1 Tax=Apophysomyces ossiformis TaxID=679940 RepID=A0A8H7BIJ9_9FUNG|nr:hypothetical protein EC973_002850 [Apophysomyces ossiformis]